MSLFLPAEHVLRQDLILLFDDREILLCQRGGVLRIRHHGLHGELRKAEIICHVEDVLCEVGVVVGEGAAHVVGAAGAGLHELLEVRHDPVIGAVSRPVDPEAVVDLLPAVQGEDHVVALPVGPLDDLIGETDAVGCEREAEVLVLLLLDGPCIGHQVLADLEVHQGLSAEEVHLQVPAKAGVLHEEVQRSLSGLKAHEALTAVKLSLGGKAVGAVQVAGVGNEETERLDHV